MNAVLAYFIAALVHGTVVAGVAGAVDRLLRRWLSFSALSLVWVLALLKFVLPFGPSLRFSVSSVVDTGQALIALDRVSVPAAPTTSHGFMGIVVTLYVCVVLALAIRHLRAYQRLREEVAALPLAPPWLHQTVIAAAQRLRLARVPMVRLGPAAFVVGWLRPTLVVPALPVSQRELESVIMHELAHLRRHDHWLRLVQHLTQLFFFFWPVVAWVNRRIEHYRELACDEQALRESGLSVTEYASVLLAARRCALAQPPLAAFEMSSQSSQLERRIDMLLDFGTRRSFALSMLALSSWGALTLSGSAFATEGSLDREVIQQTMRQHLGSVSSCFEFGLARTPTLSGTVLVSFDIEPSGATSHVSIVEGTLADQALHECLIGVVSKITFPAPVGGSVQVRYPFVFTKRVQ